MEVKQHATEEKLGQRRNKKIKRYIETNDNDSTTYQNFWNMAEW